MKPCANKRKLIAWLAVDALDAPLARDLRAHLETCAGCRGYLAEISQVKDQLAAAAPTADLRATESFHQKVMAGLENETAESNWNMAMAILRSIPLKWRVALPMAVVIPVVVLLSLRIWIVSSPRTDVPVAAAAASVDLTPSIANYQRAASQSPDTLDALLARQEAATARPAPVYTAATRSVEF